VKYSYGKSKPPRLKYCTFFILQTDSGTVVEYDSFIAVLRMEAVGRWFNRLRLSVQDYRVWCDNTRSTLDLDMTVCSLAG
jgi:hypothetical protein